MKKRYFHFLFIITTVLLLLIAFPKSMVWAEGCLVPEALNIKGNPLTFTIQPQGTDFSIAKSVVVYCSKPISDVTIPLTSTIDTSRNNAVIDKSTGNIKVTFYNETCITNALSAAKQSGVYVAGGQGNNNAELCRYNFVNVIEEYNETPKCSFSFTPNPPEPGKSYSITVNNLPLDKASHLELNRQFYGTGGGYEKILDLKNSQTYSSQKVESRGTGMYLNVTGNVNGEEFGTGTPLCSTEFSFGQTAPIDNTNDGTSPLGASDICKFSGSKATVCSDCVNKQKGIWTALGCIEVDPQKFIEKVLKIAIGMAGGIAFLMIIYGGFMMMLSSGNPEKLQNAKEIITSAIAGLLLIIFSVVILKIIGVDILDIPGF